MNGREKDMTAALLGPQFVAEQSHQDIELLRESLREKATRLELRAEQATSPDTLEYYQQKKRRINRLEDSLRKLEVNMRVDDQDTGSHDSRGH